MSKARHYTRTVRPGRFARRLSLCLLWGCLPTGSAAALDTEIHRYTWTAQERIRTIETPDGVSTYDYDGHGLRSRKQTPDGTVLYIRGAGGNVIAEYDGDGNLLAEYVYGGSRRLAKITNDGAERLYYHTDGVGTPLAMTNQDGQLVWRGESLPFGEEFSSTGDLDDRKFTGKELDRGTALHYFGARHYDAAVGRFLSTDEVGGNPAVPQTWNRYAYSRNNPLQFVDPDGRQETKSVEDQLQTLVEKARAIAQTVSTLRRIWEQNGVDNLTYVVRVIFTTDAETFDAVAKSAALGFNLGLTEAGAEAASMESPVSLDASNAPTHNRVAFSIGRAIGRGTVDGAFKAARRKGTGISSFLFEEFQYAFENMKQAVTALGQGDGEAAKAAISRAFSLSPRVEAALILIHGAFAAENLAERRLEARAEAAAADARVPTVEGINMKDPG